MKKTGSIATGILIAVFALSLGLIVGGFLLNRGVSMTQKPDSGTQTPTPTTAADRTINQTVVNSSSYQRFVKISADLNQAISGFDPRDTQYAPPEVEVSLGY